jgi:hypothetical protein
VQEWGEVGVEYCAVNWFQSHAYFATWASPVIALIALVVNNLKRSSAKVEWSWVMIYMAFLTSLGVCFSPDVQPPTMRLFAAGVSGVSFGIIAVDALWKKKRGSGQ